MIIGVFIMKQKSYLSEGIKITDTFINDIIFMCQSRMKETYFTRKGRSKSAFRQTKTPRAYEQIFTIDS